jgi:hypothetical protein
MFQGSFNLYPSATNAGGTYDSKLVENGAIIFDPDYVNAQANAFDDAWSHAYHIMGDDPPTAGGSSALAPDEPEDDDGGCQATRSSSGALLVLSLLALCRRRRDRSAGLDCVSRLTK